ncbi:1-phosphofructokinase [Corynebacterium uropygiale]|uniref:1-phosphofructokinase n=1 Tax=Corynebacterium uropygiale TaxID=1775911 RepID=A0A9X1QQQ9_9CORY|nr:1-phosphofructokinase [Corynebacterium uropygiale]
MIVTLTLNPSIDATLALAEPLHRGSVHRLQTVTRVAGGKGINVSHAVHRAGHPTLAVFPSGERDLFSTLVGDINLPHHALPIADSVRTNTTVTEPDGETTKFNGPGPTLSDAELRNLIQILLRELEDAEWLVMAGSLPPGCPKDMYSQIITAVREAHPRVRIAVDTSDAAMVELGKNLGTATPDLIKPNGMELGQLAGLNGHKAEDDAQHHQFSAVLDAAATLLDKGLKDVLVTLGSSGAVLVNREGAWHAAPPPITVVSTVGAGDCSLAGFILARTQNLSSEQCLRQAVAYGSAATSLPGTSIPDPADLDLDRTRITPLPFD